MSNVLVIGAGVAGLSAAEYLTAAGHEVAVVDKAARPGGRCATRRTDVDPAAPWFDYGAQYFTARSDLFRRSIQADLEAGRLANWQPSINIAEKTGTTWLFSPSPDDRERLIGPRGLNRWVRDRFEQLPVDVQCERRVNALRGDARQWTARFDQGGPIQATHILLTIPAVQAKALLGPAARRIAALGNTPNIMSACHTLVVEAPAIDGVEAIFFKDGALSWAADNTHKGGDTRSPHLWTLNADASYSDKHVESSAEELADTLIDDFVQATATPREQVRLVRGHRWRYARPGPAAPDADDRFWVDRKKRLALAGDWLAGGRIEGAWLSGRGAAARLIGDV